MPRWDADASKRAVTANSKVMSVDESTHEVTHLLVGEMQVFVQAKAGGTILPTSPKPMPAQTAEYTFAADGYCTWLDEFPVDKNVSSGDTVQVIYDVNSGLYSYELVPDTNRVGSAVTNDSTVAGASVSDALNILGGAIDNEAVARAAADTALQGAIDAEEAARISDVAALEGADTALQANITGVYNDLAAADTFIQSVITDETRARQAAVSGEASARAAADTALQANITGVYNDLAAADTFIQSVITDETRARQAAVSGEASARAAADTALQANITGVYNDLAAADTFIQSVITDETRARAAALAEKQTIANLSNDIIADADSTTMYPSVKEMKDYVDTNINQDEWYGIERNVTLGDSAWTRIGKLDYHRTLPIQNNRKGVLLGDDGTENFQLNPNDFNLIDTGAAADLSGASGQKMINQGRFYARYEQEGDIERVKISPYALQGFIEIDSYYISSEEASLNRTTLKLSSCVNTSAEYRGGNNTTAYDAGSNTLLGRPVTNLSLTLFRTCARNRGAKWNANVYSTAVAEYILRLVEYANSNSQLPFTEELTAEGYKQGGLGAGVTTLDSTKWTNFNGQNPFIPCGYASSLGLKSGVVNYQMPVEYDVTQPIVEVNSYRGVVIPFGHTHKHTDGVKALIQAADAGGQSLLYTTNDPSKFSSTGIEGYKLTGTLPRESGYVKQMMFGKNLDILPQVVGGSATTYFCDYFTTSIPETGVSERALLFGGNALYGSSAGCGYSTSNYSPSSANAIIGSRLCYIP